MPHCYVVNAINGRRCRNRTHSDEALCWMHETVASKGKVTWGRGICRVFTEEQIQKKIDEATELKVKKKGEKQKRENHIRWVERQIKNIANQKSAFESYKEIVVENDAVKQSRLDRFKVCMSKRVNVKDVLNHDPNWLENLVCPVPEKWIE